MKTVAIANILAICHYIIIAYMYFVACCFALGLSSFTAINPWHPCYNYYIQIVEVWIIEVGLYIYVTVHD